MNSARGSALLATALVAFAAAGAAAQDAAIPGYDGDGRVELGLLISRAVRYTGIPGSLGALAGAAALVWTISRIVRRAPRGIFLWTAAFWTPALGLAACDAAFTLASVENVRRQLGPAVTAKDIAAGEMQAWAPVLLVGLVTLPAIVLAAYGAARDWTSPAQEDDS